MKESIKAIWEDVFNKHEIAMKSWRSDLEAIVADKDVGKVMASLRDANDGVREFRDDVKAFRRSNDVYCKKEQVSDQ